MRDLARYRSLMFTILTLITAASIDAHTLDAPPDVVAELDGSFSYEMVLTAGPGTLLLAGMGWSGIENTGFGSHGDCLCAPGCDLPEGESWTYLVDGALEDPTLPGIVENWAAPCDSGDLRVVTTIHPATIDVEGIGLVLQGFHVRPNPLSERTAMAFVLPDAADVVAEVFDARGRHVARPYARRAAPGTTSFVWDVAASEAAPGIYFVRVSVDGVARATRRLVVSP